MQIQTVHIRNFRSIEDASFFAEPYTLLVGANNAGKSAAIDCLLAFYEKDGRKFRANRDLPFCSDNRETLESWIDLEFALTEEEQEKLPEHYQREDKRFKVRRWFQTAEKDAKGRSLNGVIVAYLPDGKLHNEPAFGAPNVQKGKFGEVIYIPAVSTVDEHTKVSGPSALRDLLNDVLKGVVTASPSYDAFSDAFEGFRQSIKDDQSTDGRSLKGLESQINKRIGSWGADFSLELTAPDPAAIVKNNISHAFTDSHHGYTQEANQFGSGFQRQFIYTLIEVAAAYATKSNTKKKDFTPDLTLILFEEPEAFLHPTQQESLARKLRGIAGENGRQVFCSTHSAHFVSKNCDQLGSIIRLRRDQGKTRLFQVLANRWEQIVEDNHAINEALGKAAPENEIEGVRYFLWLDATRCGLFFANHVILVEGATEYALFSRLVSDGKLDIGEQGVFFLDTLGKHNTHRFMNLLSAMGITHSVILDDDENNGKHQKLNRLAEESRDPEFTQAVEFFEGNLETALGLKDENPERRDLKPQHVLTCYEGGKVPDDCLSKVISKIEKCLTVRNGSETGTTPVSQNERR